MSKAQPTRRTLVKGAAWSVPVVATGARAAHAAGSCSVALTACCHPTQGLVIGYTLTQAAPFNLEFTVTIGTPNSGGIDPIFADADGQVTGSGTTRKVKLKIGTGTTGVLFRATRPSTTGNANPGVRTISVLATAGCTSNPVDARFDGATCTGAAAC